MNLERTRIHCPTCGTFHPADYVEVDGVAFWRVHCPHGDHDGLLSDLYCMPPGSRMRKRVSFGLAFLRRLGLRRLLMLRKSLRYSSDDGEHLQMFSISSLMTPDRLDLHRFGRCFSGVVTPSGAICPPCYYYGMRFPHILKARSGVKQGKEGA